jgi:putative transposase
VYHKLSLPDGVGGTVRAFGAGAMRPYSEDLRKRIVDAYRRLEGSVRELANRFMVDPKTVQNYLNLERETGSVAPRPHGGGPKPKLDDAAVQQVRTVVEEKNDRTLDEIGKELETRAKVHVSRSTVWRIADRLDLTRKKRRSARASRSGPTFSKTERSSSSTSSR